LSRQRKIQCSSLRSGAPPVGAPRSGTVLSGRSRTLALIAVGAVTVATAATATAASQAPGPSEPTAARAHEAAGRPLLIVTGQPIHIESFQQSTANEAVQAYQIRDAGAELAAAHWMAARAQAAKKRAAAAAPQSTAQTTAQAPAQPAATAQPAQATTAAVSSAASGSPQQIAEAMLGSFGWSGSQFSCLDPLWEHESGWSVTAYNPGSGAYGIPQALPGSRMASAGPDWQTDAATQVRWGLEYIQDTYGSPCAAWDHELATGWY
jgi:hypothetical protein